MIRRSEAGHGSIFVINREKCKKRSDRRLTSRIFNYE